MLWKIQRYLTLVIGVALCAALSSGSRGSAPGSRLGDHYLMLVNTATASSINKAQFAQFNRSHYDGLAVSFSPSYDVSAPPPAKQIETQLADWKTVTKKDIWPWVFLNRMIGASDSENNSYAQNAYFRRIQGADLDGKEGAQSDFLLNWGNALRAAKDLHVPGIVCDLEFYNNYKEYDPRELAKSARESTEQAIWHLRALGAQMADIAAEQYPDAVIWFLFTGFSNAGYTGASGEHYFLSSSYVVFGLLDEIQKRGLPLLVYSGGEVGLGGYCHPSLGQFRDQIYNRNVSFAPYLKRYSGSLELGGTMTLWSDRSAKQGWVAEGDCADCPAATVEDLQPYLELLLKSYKYNWVYGAGAAGYYAFDPHVAPRFDAMIAKAKANTGASNSR